jgi:hypothetical protein
MKRIHLISKTTLSRFKQRARQLKRAEHIPHHQALESVAKSAGFDSWHQVTDAAEQCRPIEEAYLNGFVIAFDGSEVPDFESEDFPMQLEAYAFDLLRDRLFANYAGQADEEDPEQRPISVTLEPDDLREYFEEDWGSLYFFRLKTPGEVKTVAQLLDLVHKHSFWRPRFVFTNGNLLDTYDLPSVNREEEVVGFRF